MPEAVTDADTDSKGSTKESVGDRVSKLPCTRKENFQLKDLMHQSPLGEEWWVIIGVVGSGRGVG